MFLRALVFLYITFTFGLNVDLSEQLDSALYFANISPPLLPFRHALNHHFFSTLFAFHSSTNPNSQLPHLLCPQPGYIQYAVVPPSYHWTSRLAIFFIQTTNGTTHPFSPIYLRGRMERPVPSPIITPSLHATIIFRLISIRGRHSFWFFQPQMYGGIVTWSFLSVSSKGGNKTQNRDVLYAKEWKLDESNSSREYSVTFSNRQTPKYTSRLYSDCMPLSSNPRNRVRPYILTLHLTSHPWPSPWPPEAGKYSNAVESILENCMALPNQVCTATGR
jgi:hypothetical protein